MEWAGAGGVQVYRTRALFRLAHPGLTHPGLAPSRAGAARTASTPAGPARASPPVAAIRSTRAAVPR